MPTPALALILKILGPKHDPGGRIHILRASQDPGLKAYLDFADAAGATDMDTDGQIYVKIDDTREDIKGLCLEELYHALQYMQDGNVPLESDNAVRNRRELEVARCLLASADRLRLSASDRQHYSKAVGVYGGQHGA
jgi:hypothetical protein